MLFVGLLGVGLAACGSPPPASIAPSSTPAPTATPDPHLVEPVSADDIFRDIGKGGLKISAVNANLGQGNPDIVKVINADLGGWPLRITQYRSSAILGRALAWTAGQRPGADEAPFAFAGLNILITFGPISAAPPSAPDPARSQAATALVGVLDPLLWPLAQRSVTVIPSRTAAPIATPTPSPTASPRATPRPSLKPTPKPSKRP